MTPDRREILERVAAGELSPEEADALLDGDDAPVEAPGRAGGIRRVRVEAGFGAISIVGDAEVAEAEIDGMHTASVEGDTLVIAGDFDGVRAGGFAINLGGRKARRVGMRAGRIGRRDFMAGAGGPSALRVRMNPALPLDAKLDAGPMSIAGIEAPIRARSSAGPITIDDVAAPVDVAVNAGAIRINGRLDGGESRVRSDAGAIRIELERSSSVRITASAALGKVVLPGAEDGSSRGFGSVRDATIGEGAGVLRIETAMGSIYVSTG